MSLTDNSFHLIKSDSHIRISLGGEVWTEVMEMYWNICCDF